MLFWVGTELDFGRMGADAPRLWQAQEAHLRALRDEGVLMRIWQRANGRGHLMLWNALDGLDVDRRVEALPTFHHAMRLEVDALNPHRLFGQFSQPRRASGRARGELYFVRLLIDRARLGPDRPAELIEVAERNARRHVDDGQVIGIWRLPHGSGAHIVWQCSGTAELHHELSTLPLKGAFSEVSAMPIVPEPALADLAGWEP
jgi:muconolactone delta-isomerase